MGGCVCCASGVKILNVCTLAVWIFAIPLRVADFAILTLPAHGVRLVIIADKHGFVSGIILGVAYSLTVLTSAVYYYPIAGGLIFWIVFAWFAGHVVCAAFMAAGWITPLDRSTTSTISYKSMPSSSTYSGLLVGLLVSFPVTGGAAARSIFEDMGFILWILLVFALGMANAQVGPHKMATVTVQQTEIRYTPYEFDAPQHMEMR